MAVEDATLRPAEADDEDAWRTLWRGYCDFYRRRVSERVTHETWRRILAPFIPYHCVVAHLDGSAVGFATSVDHPVTWSVRPACHLEDLFVAEHARGTGVGRALVEHALRTAFDRGCSRIYWMTEADNIRARSLYDHFTLADGFVRYLLTVRPD